MSNRNNRQATQIQTNLDASLFPWPGVVITVITIIVIAIIVTTLPRNELRLGPCVVDCCLSLAVTITIIIITITTTSITAIALRIVVPLIIRSNNLALRGSGGRR